jgi:hypothetical protein
VLSDGSTICVEPITQTNRHTNRIPACRHHPSTLALGVKLDIIAFFEVTMGNWTPTTTYYYCCIHVGPGPPSVCRKIYLQLLRWSIILRSRSTVRSQVQSVEQSSQGKLLRRLLASGAFAVVVTSIYEYLSLSGVVDMGAARIVLFFAWFIGTIGTFVSETVGDKSLKYKIVSTGLVGLLRGILFIALDAWTTGYKAWQQDQQERYEGALYKCYLLPMYPYKRLFSP